MYCYYYWTGVGSCCEFGLAEKKKKRLAGKNFFNLLGPRNHIKRLHCPHYIIRGTGGILYTNYFRTYWRYHLRHTKIMRFTGKSQITDPQGWLLRATYVHCYRFGEMFTNHEIDWPTTVTRAATQWYA